MKLSLKEFWVIHKNLNLVHTTNAQVIEDDSNDLKHLIRNLLSYLEEDKNLFGLVGDIPNKLIEEVKEKLDD